MFESASMTLRRSRERSSDVQREPGRLVVGFAADRDAGHVLVARMHQQGNIAANGKPE